MTAKAMSTRVFDNPWRKRSKGRGLGTKSDILDHQTGVGVGLPTVPQKTLLTLRASRCIGYENLDPCYIRKETLSDGFLSEILKKLSFLLREGVVARGSLLVLTIISRSICIAIY